MTVSDLIAMGSLIVGGVTVPVMLLLWNNRIAVKKDVDQKHDENMKKFNELLAEAKYFPPHRHREYPGEILNRDGIQFPNDL